MVPCAPMNPASPAPIATAQEHLHWDIFCAVVDNYGDIGVCWRLARQLAAEIGFQVRLWVDDLTSFARLCPELDCGLHEQTVQEVVIRHWSSPFPETTAADVVVEAFACNLPENYLQAMATRPRPPAWINLEYLTAEDWAAHCHGVASPHPRLPLLKFFFFPGFDGRTGGLLRERDLLAARDAFQASTQEQQGLWSRLGATPALGEMSVSLFCYGHLPLASLLDAWAAGPTPILCFMPLGPALPEVHAWSSGALQQAGNVLQRGRLRLVLMDFLPQADYDRLLWACDLNFVRGEDSFVRAQWAGKPFVWQIYPQEEKAHEAKLEAFLQCYSQGLEANTAAGLQRFWQAWNGSSAELPGACWENYQACLPALACHDVEWSQGLAALPSLAESLADFCRNKL